MIVLTPLHKIRYQSKVSFSVNLTILQNSFRFNFGIEPNLLFCKQSTIQLTGSYNTLTQPPNINMFTTRLCMEVNNNQGQGHLKECMTHDRINFEVNININSRDCDLKTSTISYLL